MSKLDKKLGHFLKLTFNLFIYKNSKEKLGPFKKGTTATYSPKGGLWSEDTGNPHTTGVGVARNSS